MPLCFCALAAGDAASQACCAPLACQALPFFALTSHNVLWRSSLGRRVASAATATSPIVRQANRAAVGGASPMGRTAKLNGRSRTYFIIAM